MRYARKSSNTKDRGADGKMDREEAIVWAWWNLLDTDKSGQLSNREFIVALKSIGFKGNIKKAFAEMNESGNGQISIHELDASAGEFFLQDEIVRID